MTHAFVHTYTAPPPCEHCPSCSLVEVLRPFAGMRHLDVAGGTGDVAFRVGVSPACACPASQLAFLTRPSACVQVLRGIRAAEAQRQWNSSYTSTNNIFQPSKNRPQAATQAPGPDAEAEAQPTAEAEALPEAEAEALLEAEAEELAEAQPAGEAEAQPAAEAEAQPADTITTGSSSSKAAAAPDKLPLGSVVVCDINKRMLEEGRRKAAAEPGLAGPACLLLRLRFSSV
jgi:hypothetical protein